MDSNISIMGPSLIVYIENNTDKNITVQSQDVSVNGFMNMPKAILNAFTYAGFQCVTLPTIVACGAILPDRKSCSKAMWISFVMNAVAFK